MSNGDTGLDGQHWRADTIEMGREGRVKSKVGVSHSFSGHTKPNGSLHHSDTHTQNTHHSKDTHEDVADTLLPHRMWKTRSTLSPEEEKESEQRGGEKKGHR